MLRRRIATIGLGTAAMLAVGVGSAFADDCSNVSRPAPACDMSCTAPVVTGNWVWLPSVGIPEPVWGFAPPGGFDSELLGFPGSNGNYTNGQADDLLGVAAAHSAGVCSTPTRTTDPHGINSGACASG
jgi:hypothetical protein